MSRIHATAEVALSAQIGEGVSIWQFAHICDHSRLGNNVTIGRGVYLGNGVQVGANSKIQNYAMVYEPAILERGVFIGPGVILTNDKYPRAINPDGTQKNSSDWNLVKVTVREGATISAGSICIAPIEIGAWAFVAAGSIVTKNVPAFALVAGAPARKIGWVGKAGIPLINNGFRNFSCPKTGEHYFERDDDTLVEMDRSS
jgi:acetyltransferase-like isoleucine patch superfamily enzyme